jgi:hypothetical protein
VTSMCTTFHPTGASGQRESDERRVVVTFPLTNRQMSSLRAQLGLQFTIVDPSTAVRADIVICPPCSTRTIEKLRQQYPTAAILVVEPDGRSGSLDAPVTRLLAAGAAAYLTDPSAAGLAAAVRAIVGRPAHTSFTCTES